MRNVVMSSSSNILPCGPSCEVPSCDGKYSKRVVYLSVVFEAFELAPAQIQTLASLHVKQVGHGV